MPSEPTSDERKFQALFDVSRETLERLGEFQALLLKWNRKINLVSRGEQEVLWDRHMIDSAQLWALCPPSVRKWLDLGSGAGFPGLVIAALAQDKKPETEFVLVESDTRKAIFLGEAARAMGLQVAILAQRIESLNPVEADVISARALAPLTRLLEFSEKHRSASGVGLFPKGEKVHKEVADAKTKWRFSYRLHGSITSPTAAIVEIGDISRV